MNLRTNFLIAMSLFGEFDQMHAGAILGGWRTKSDSEMRPHNTVPGLSFGGGGAIARAGGQVRSYMCTCRRCRFRKVDVGWWR